MTDVINPALFILIVVKLSFYRRFESAFVSEISPPPTAKRPSVIPRIIMILRGVYEKITKDLLPGKAGQKSIAFRKCTATAITNKMY
ncbi:MAG TPA: hypothetical protein PK228_00420 [Saprospiraceae bacterium]|nr:hypothetical protein [Saprospiraceae bacterium]